jgi:hypothetical protein
MDIISVGHLMTHPNDFEYAFLVMNASTYQELVKAAAATGMDRNGFKKAALLGIKDASFLGQTGHIYVCPDFYELMRWAKTGGVIAPETAQEMEGLAPPPDHVYVYEDQIDTTCKTMAERVALRKEYRDYNNLRELDLAAIRNALDEKGMYGLNVEVLYSAFDSIRTNPKRSIADAIADGINEWIK